ncbi:MAG: hypothetical protein Q8O14_12940 [bacterium]|nr:hypothetical protein [bacterium]
MHQQMIREELTRQGRNGINPRWIEGWMRLELGCLDWLDKPRFRREVTIAAQCVDASTTHENETLAMSLLGPPRSQRKENTHA